MRSRTLNFAALCLLATSTSFAASAKHPVVTETPTESTVESHSEMHHASLGGPIAFGVSDTFYLTGGQSLSALFPVGDHDKIHAFVGINGTSGSFDFGVGAAYKITIAGDHHAGFHVGPGVSVGSLGSKFAFAVYGLAGGHFTIADRVIVSVDGGPILSVIDGNANFRLRPMGSLLGLSVHYLF